MFFLHVKNVRYKILSKYIYMGSCFEEFITRNTTVQSKFNLDVYFVNYRFFKFTTNHDITVLFIYTCMHLYVLEGVLRPARGLGPNARPLAAKNVPTRMTIERPAAFTGIRFGADVAGWVRLPVLMDLYIHPLYVVVSKIISYILNSPAPIHHLYHHLFTLST
jgi:hypothetical protein